MGSYWGLSKPEEMCPLVNGPGVIGQHFQGDWALGLLFMGQAGMNSSFSTLEPLVLKCRGRQTFCWPFVCLPKQIWGLPWWLRWSSICLQCWRPGFSPWVGKSSWSREWPPTPVFLLRESLGQRSLAGYSPWGRTESDMTEGLPLTHFQAHVSGR